MAGLGAKTRLRTIPIFLQRDVRMSELGPQHTGPAGWHQRASPCHSQPAPTGRPTGQLTSRSFNVFLLVNCSLNSLDNSKQLEFNACWTRFQSWLLREAAPRWCRGSTGSRCPASFQTHTWFFLKARGGTFTFHTLQGLTALLRTGLGSS